MARYVPPEVPRGVESRVSRHNPIPSPIDQKYPSGRGRFVSFHRLSLPWTREWSLWFTYIAPLFSNRGVSSEWGVKPGGVDFQPSVGSFSSRIRGDWTDVRDGPICGIGHCRVPHAGMFQPFY
eukprot:scaffold538_cov413-Pavlova_lutheri.AAC.8